MVEIDHIDEDTGWIDFDFVQNEETFQQLMELCIERCVGRLSLRDTVPTLEIPVSYALGLPFRTGCRRPIYGPIAARIRIEARPTRR